MSEISATQILLAALVAEGLRQTLLNPQQLMAEFQQKLSGQKDG